MFRPSSAASWQQPSAAVLLNIARRTQEWLASRNATPKRRADQSAREARGVGQAERESGLLRALFVFVALLGLVYTLIGVSVVGLALLRVP